MTEPLDRPRARRSGLRSAPPDRGENAADPDWIVAAGRGAMYGFLARSLLYPTEESKASIRDRLVPVLSSCRPASVELDDLVATAIRAHEAPLDDMRLAHGRVFTHIENQDCPAHESAYSPGDVFRRADVMADVAAFYRAHGLQVGGSRRERVDHITTELEFVSFLARKQAFAIEHLGIEEIDECRRSQELFLRDHLGCWAPGFAARLQVAAEEPFLDAIGGLLAAWLEADLGWLGVEPAAQHHEPQPQPPPDDDRCGVTTGATPVEITR